MLLSSATACELLPAGKGGQIDNVGAGLTCGRGIGAPCGGGLERLRLGGRWRRGSLASSLKSRFEVRLNAMKERVYCFEVRLNAMKQRILKLAKQEKRHYENIKTDLTDLKED